MTIQKYIFLFASLFFLSGCNRTDVERAMVEFDQAFIPAYYYTYTQDVDRAQRAILVLDQRQQQLRAEFAKKAPDAHNWCASVTMVDAWIKEAHHALQERNMARALIQLDHARYELMDLRWREDITYYLDNVYDLEAAIDIVREVSTDPMIDLLEWEEFMPMVVDLEQAWNEVENATWEAVLFNFSEDAKFDEAARKLILAQAIKNFVVAVDCADRITIEAAAKEMEKAYLSYLYSFGNFAATQTFYAAL